MLVEDGNSWYFQEYNHYIVKSGELRVFIADKDRILGRVITRPKADSGMMKMGWKLERFSDLLL
jgi:hypothetical protein